MLPERQTAAEISYRESGAKDLPALVLLHGIGSTSAAWRLQYGPLSEQFRVIGWDAPGYGDSKPLPQEAPSAEAYAHALARLLEAHGVMSEEGLDPAAALAERAQVLARRITRMSEPLRASLMQEGTVAELSYPCTWKKNELFRFATLLSQGSGMLVIAGTLGVTEVSAPRGGALVEMIDS